MLLIMIKEKKAHVVAFYPHIFKATELNYNIYVVATTCHSRTNDLTTSKALQWAIK